MCRPDARIDDGFAAIAPSAVVRAVVTFND